MLKVLVIKRKNNKVYVTKTANILKNLKTFQSVIFSTKIVKILNCYLDHNYHNIV